MTTRTHARTHARTHRNVALISLAESASRIEMLQHALYDAKAILRTRAGKPTFVQKLHLAEALIAEALRLYVSDRGL